MIQIELVGYKLGKFLGDTFKPLVSRSKLANLGYQFMPVRNINEAFDAKANGFRLGFLKSTGINLGLADRLPLDVYVFDGVYRVIRPSGRSYRVVSRYRCQCPDCPKLAICEVWERRQAQYTLDRDEDGRPEVEEYSYQDVSSYCLSCGWSDFDTGA